MQALSPEEETHDVCRVVEQVPPPPPPPPPPQDALSVSKCRSLVRTPLQAPPNFLQWRGAAAQEGPDSLVHPRTSRLQICTFVLVDSSSRVQRCTCKYVRLVVVSLSLRDSSFGP